MLSSCRHVTPCAREDAQVYRWMYVCMYVWMYVCMKMGLLCVYVCMYVCERSQSWKKFADQFDFFEVAITEAEFWLLSTA